MMAHGMDALEASARIRGAPAADAAAIAGKARHPRSRGERALLEELKKSLDAALEVARAPGRYDGLLAEAAAAATTTRPVAVVADPARTRFASNGAPAPSLFYAPPPACGAGLAGRPPPGLTAEEEAAMSRYGVQQLSDYARATLLGEIAEYLPPHHDEATSRQRFDALLARVQQHQIARTVQNE